MTLTIFVATFNRLETLECTIASYRRMTTPYEVRIVDNGTDHPKCVELLERLEQLPEVRKVYPLGKITTMDELTDNFTVAFADAYQSASFHGDWFAVTDADICFDGSDSGTFDAYLRLAQATRNAVGPHLRADAGISHGYPLRSRVLAAESRLLYRRWMEEHDGIHFSRLPIDTTFHLFPAISVFRRMRMDTLRVAPPYDAMHLDWYSNIFAPSEENDIYIPSGWSWGGSWIRDFWDRYQADPEATFRFLHTLRRPAVSLCNTSFFISWCYQFGAGTDVDLAESKRWLRAAIAPWYEREVNMVEDDWMRFVYDGDFSALGWQEAPVAV